MPLKFDPKSLDRRHFPNKKLSQHFLIDPRIRDRILKACQITSQETVLEIGPGTGMLTKTLVKQASHVFAVEIDKDLCRGLEETIAEKNLTIIQQDFLKYDLRNIPPGTKVIGNLPYRISTPIIEKMIHARPLFSEIFITVQWEFGRRMTAAAGTRDYGALSCFVQYCCDAKLLFPIKNTCFRPIPKVQSCFIKLTMTAQKERAHNEELLFDVIRTAFQMRRKKIINALGRLIPRETIRLIMSENKWADDLRPENLTLQNYIALSNRLMELGCFGETAGEEN